MAFELQGGYATPRADLGMALIEYRREGGGNWATSKILPTLAVTKKTATFSAYPRASLLLTGDAKRAFGGTYNRITAAAVDHTYNCQNYGLEQLIDDKQRGFLANDFDTDFAAALFTETRIRRIQEVRTANLLFSTTTFSTNYTDYSVTGPWTALSADIFGNIIDAMESSRRLTGMPPNTILVGKPVFNIMKKNTALRDSFRNVATSFLAGDEPMKEYFANLFGVKQFIVADEVYNSAADPGGNSSVAATVTDIWAKNYCLVAYCAEQGASLEEPSLGRLVVWDYVPELAVTSYREESRSSDVIRVEHFVQEYVYDQSYGYLLKVQ